MNIRRAVSLVGIPPLVIFACCAVARRQDDPWSDCWIEVTFGGVTMTSDSDRPCWREYATTIDRVVVDDDRCLADGPAGLELRVAGTMGEPRYTGRWLVRASVSVLSSGDSWFEETSAAVRRHAFAREVIPLHGASGPGPSARLRRS